MKVFAENRKAYFNYKILEKFEAGIVLTGHEVKSTRLGRMSLEASFVVFGNEEPYLIGSKIPPYQPLNTPTEYNTERSRKLLLKKEEIKYLLGKSMQRGLTLVPIRVYTNDGKIKLEFGVGQGLKRVDKRELIKKREAQREIQRELRSRG